MYTARSILVITSLISLRLEKKSITAFAVASHPRHLDDHVHHRSEREWQAGIPRRPMSACASAARPTGDSAGRARAGGRGAGTHDGTHRHLRGIGGGAENGERPPNPVRVLIEAGALRLA